MDGLGRAVGDGITGLIAGAFDVIGGTLRGMVDAGNRALPGGLFFVVVFAVVAVVGWNLVRRMTTARSAVSGAATTIHRDRACGRGHDVPTGRTG